MVSAEALPTAGPPAGESTGQSSKSGSAVGLSPAASGTSRTKASTWDVVRAYFALTKPRIIEQLLITTLPAMMLAAGGLGSPFLILMTLIGGMLSAGSANSLNCYVDRDIDSVMRRTARRPLVRHTITPGAALTFGLVLGVASTAVFWFFTTPLATGLNVLAILLYVVLYTMLLKRRTSQNIVWGGTAGCMPVLIGWAAVTGSLSLAPMIMFAIIFFWTPPHFWALAIKYKDDYAAAGVPMLPVVAKPTTVTAQMLGHAIAMVGCSIWLWPVATTALYGVTVSVLGAWFLYETARLHVRTRRGAAIRPMRVFHMSNTYLTLVFILIGIDALVG